MVIDGLVGFTGGYNMANEYFNLTHPYGYWKDTGVQIAGLAVRSLTATFLENWNAVKGNDIDDADFGKYLEQPYADPHAMAEEIGGPGKAGLMCSLMQTALWIMSMWARKSTSA